MFFIEIKDNLIFCKGQGVILQEGQIEVDEEVYNQLQIPSTFDLVDDNITNIEAVPLPIYPESVDEVELLKQEMAEQKALMNAILGVAE